MGVARQASTLTAAGLVEELKAEGEEEGEDELDERVGVGQEPKIGRLIVEIDGEGAVVTYRFGGVPHVSSPGQRPCAQMRHGEGNVLKEQGYCERLGSSPLNSVECEKAWNEHSCHSRQSSVSPLSGCAINLRFEHLVFHPMICYFKGLFACATSRATINVPPDPCYERFWHRRFG